MDFDQIVDEVAQEYLAGIHAYQSQYSQISFGSHTPEDGVLSTAKNFKVYYYGRMDERVVKALGIKKGIDGVYQYASDPKVYHTPWAKPVISELYARLRTRLQRENFDISGMPELSVKIDPDLDYRAKLAKEALEKPGPGWELGEKT